MADMTINSIAENLIPGHYRTDQNRKFLQSTVDQVVRPGTLKKSHGYIGRKTTRAITKSDVYVPAADKLREWYQLEPACIINNEHDQPEFYKDYIDYLNQLSAFGADVSTQPKLNKQEFYSWDPHIDWDKFVNFQNYYWMPYGPSAVVITGNSTNIITEYNVSISTVGKSQQYVLSTEVLEPNPIIKLKRGQTYHFNIDSPGNPFSIKTARTEGAGDRYTHGIDLYSATSGIIKFTVPLNSPDILYYTSESNLDLGGVFQIVNLDDNEFDVKSELLGKKTYRMANGHYVSNGMKVTFTAQAIPSQYASKSFYIEGVGESIKLIPETDLYVSSLYANAVEEGFDTTGFGTGGFDGSRDYTGMPDYIVANRGSLDKNPWCRFNRWFHKDVIETSAKINGIDSSLNQIQRAVRPIIEYTDNLKLFNFGTRPIDDVDLIDTFTTDVFSTIEGSHGYFIDGIKLTHGHRILFTADTNTEVKNKIYRVEMVDVKHLATNSKQIHLVLDTTPNDHDSLLIKFGNKNQGMFYWFNNGSWKYSQQKTTINQPILFDVVDKDGNSFSEMQGSTFAGTKLFSYKIGHGLVDTTLGFPLTYKTISNIGDIVFNFDFAGDTFKYENGRLIETKQINSGYLLSSNSDYSFKFLNGWRTNTATTTQAAIRVYDDVASLNNFTLDIFDDFDNLTDLVLRVYVNGKRLSATRWSLVSDTNTKTNTIRLTNDIEYNDVLSIKAYTTQPINELGYYEVPVTLQNNPLNQEVTEFTLGEVIDHVDSIIDNLDLKFTGEFPGNNNLRDLGNVASLGTKFVQHSGPIGLSLYHMTTEHANALKAVNFARDGYAKFKRQFISVATTLGMHFSNTADHVSAVLNEIAKNMPLRSPFYYSDMVAFGAYTKADLNVVDYRRKTYSLSQPFDLDTLNTKAVYVYLNKNQILHGRDYTFDPRGFINVTCDIKNDDVITIYEYENTDGCYIPETPSKLGLWPKFQPMKYLDTTLITPREVIQGHDGSITLAYGDYRDGLLLELESRIYNNIKVKYDSSIYDIYSIIPGQSRQIDVSINDFNHAIASEFYKWTTNIDRDFTRALQYDRGNPFTYNYKTSTQVSIGTQGYWRGIYKFVYDTDRPHLCPWELLGLSEKPSWWDTEYGKAPYTSNNLILWDDLANGLIKDPDGSYTIPSMAKPYLLDFLPVDEEGNLSDPIKSNLTSSPIGNDIADDYIFGDISPVENAWRRSSHFPFSMIAASLLLKPAQTLGVALDRANVIRDVTGQLVYKPTGHRISPHSLILPTVSGVKTAGLVNYIVDYIRANTTSSYTAYASDLKNLSFKLAYRVGGYTNKDSFKISLGSKSASATSGIFVPPEDFQIILNTSSPIKKMYYSGVIVTKNNDGFTVSGYNKSQPYFTCYEPFSGGISTTVGGVSESFYDWTPNTVYGKDTIVLHLGKYYRAINNHTTGASFDPADYNALTELPVLGGRTAVIRSQWDKDTVKYIPYGKEFLDLQSVVDVILGHGEYLTDQGFIFDEFDADLNRVANWETSVREFLFWTLQNWTSGKDKWVDWDNSIIIKNADIVRYNGDYYQALRTIPALTPFDFADYLRLDYIPTEGNALIALSPVKAKIKFNKGNTAVMDISNPFIEYEIVDVNSNAIPTHYLNSFSDSNIVTYDVVDGIPIFGASFSLVQLEHVLVLNNKTIFNDTIYTTNTGYKHDRVKISAYTSSDWNGTLYAPGFVIDQGKINSWQAWQDYHTGDTVKYKEFYYSATKSIQGSELFDPTDWRQMSKAPKVTMLPNMSTKATQIESYYDLDRENFDTVHQDLASHLFGYQSRDYLNNLLKNDVSEFKFYQGMIKDKGTTNAFANLFDVLGNNTEDNLQFFEEWAVRVGQYGANASYDVVEFALDETRFNSNPQAVSLSATPNNSKFIIDQLPNDVYLKPVSYNTKPWPQLAKMPNVLRDGGYVRETDVRYQLKSLDELDQITSLRDGDFIWCTFVQDSWNVYRYNYTTTKITNIDHHTMSVSSTAGLSIGTYIGVEQIDATPVFAKIVDMTPGKITVDILGNSVLSFKDLSKVNVFVFESRRASSIDTADQNFSKKLGKKELVWTDNNGDWVVWEHQPAYKYKELSFNYHSMPTGAIHPEVNGFGQAIAINKLGTIAAIATESNSIVVYERSTEQKQWNQHQFLVTPEISDDFSLTPSQATITALCLSSDGQWLVSGHSNANNIKTLYKGEFIANHSYLINDIVSVSGSYYKATASNMGTSSPSDNFVDWIPTPYITAESNGISSGFTEQGAVTLYKKDSNNMFAPVASITSPDVIANNKFGTTLAFGTNTLLIGGEENGVGKLYKMTYGDVIRTTAYVNPNGTHGRKLVVSSTNRIKHGMKITGDFDGYYVVTNVIDDTTLTIDRVPSVRLTGKLLFADTTWSFDNNTISDVNNAIITADSSKIIVGDAFAKTVRVYDTATMSINADIVSEIPVNSYFSSLAVTTSGEYLVLANTIASTDNSGQVSIFKLIDNKYRLHQVLSNVLPEPSDAFGHKVLISHNGKSLFVFSKYADNIIDTSFDNNQLSLDELTTYMRDYVNSGRVDVYDLYENNWVYSESLDTSIDINASTNYGQGIAITDNSVLISAPAVATSNSNVIGKVFEFKKSENTYSWGKAHHAVSKPDVKRIKQAFLYNKSSNDLITYIDIIDPLQGKFAGVADQEIKYKLLYDPAKYTFGIDTVNVDPGEEWLDNQVGTLWWDLSTAKFINPYDDNVAYRTQSWNTLVHGASIDVYEWVSSKLKPSQWNHIADTNEGLAQGISGTSLYDDSVYSIKAVYDNVGQFTIKTYYYWVKNKTIVPNTTGRRLSANSIAQLIANPKGAGYRYLALTGLDSFSLTNVSDLLKNDEVVLSVEYWLGENNNQNTHGQWKLVSNAPSTILPEKIKTKWIDSLCGKDQLDRLVPDLSLPTKLRYGIETRPRQSMFVNRYGALKQFIDKTNSTLLPMLITNSRNLSKLHTVDIAPSITSGRFDTRVDTNFELEFVSVKTFKKPVLSAVVENGRITGVKIISTGKGYMVPPTIKVMGTGTGAKIKASINEEGQLTSCQVINTGYGYGDNTTLVPRDFTVLVNNDDTTAGWGLYAYGVDRKAWTRIQSQAFDTTRYWDFVDWYAYGFNKNTYVKSAVDSYDELSALSNIFIGDIVKVRYDHNGKWALMLKVNFSVTNDINEMYQIVGQEQGTIQFSKLLYDFKDTIIGYDGMRYDADGYDIYPTVELRYILEAIIEDIIIGDAKEVFLALFFDSVRYAMSEQMYVDWIFKTSFVKVQHDIGKLTQPVVYNPLDLSNFEKYIDEIKPYRTKVREFVSTVNHIEDTQTSVSDFDLPPLYDAATGKIITRDITVENNKVSDVYDAAWTDSLGYEIVDVVVIDGGHGYIDAPTVSFSDMYDVRSGYKITNTTTAKAFISNGILTRIQIITNGNYLKTPDIYLNGGLSFDGEHAKVVAIIGNGKMKSSLINMKYDRISSQEYITHLQETEAFISDGYRVQYNLKWAPNILLGASTLVINGARVPTNEYSLHITNNTGVLMLKNAPKRDIVIALTYNKDIRLLNAVDRIVNFYEPDQYGPGKNINQLLTGVDYGGTIVSGSGFNTLTGWGSQLFDTVGWDSFDDNYNQVTITVEEDYTNHFTFPTETLVVYEPVVADPSGNANIIGATTIIVTTYRPVVIGSRATTPDNAVNALVTSTRTLSDFIIDDFMDVQYPIGSLLGDFAGSTEIPQLVEVTVDTALTGNISAGQLVKFERDYRNFITLPYVPADEQVLTVYLARHYVSSYIADGVTTQFNYSNAVEVPTATIYSLMPVIDDIHGIANKIGTTSVIVSTNYQINIGDIVTIPNSTAINFDTHVTKVKLLSGIVIDDFMDAQYPIGSLFGDFPGVVDIPLIVELTLDQPLYGNLFAGDTIRVENNITSFKRITTRSLILQQPIPLGYTLEITTLSKDKRVDDLHFDTGEQTNPNAIMKPLIGDGVTNVFPIPAALQAIPGDRITIRKIESDGSTYSNSNYDTSLDGGNLDYLSARGISPTDLVLDGSGFVTPDTSYAPEEVVPGHMSDALMIKVFEDRSSGTAKIDINYFVSDGITTRYKINQTPNSSDAVIVKVGNEILSKSIDYTIDFTNREVIFNTAPAINALINLYVYGFNGRNIIANERTVITTASRHVTTQYKWSTHINAAVYINGESVAHTLFNDAGFIRIDLIDMLPVGTILNYLIYAGDTQSFSTVKTQRIIPNGSLNYPLVNAIGDSLPNESNIIVRVGQRIMSAPNNVYYPIADNNLTYSISKTVLAPNVSSKSDIKVYVDGVELQFNTDYKIDIKGIDIKLSKRAYTKYQGRELLVSVIDKCDYSLVTTPTGKELVFKVIPVDPIEVTSFYKQDILDIKRTETSIVNPNTISSDSIEYHTYTNAMSGILELNRTVVDYGYLWVIKNGLVLNPSVDYKLADTKHSIVLGEIPSIDDKFEFITFAGNYANTNVSFAQFKDMLNKTHYIRLNNSKQTKLAVDLHQTDTSIIVENGGILDRPNIVTRSPGVIEVNGERIEYYEITGNKLSRIHRATLGTGAPTVHKAGTIVQFIGVSEQVPFSDNITIEQYTYDDNLLIPVSTLPIRAANNAWHNSSIPDEYGQCENLEVFVGGYLDTNDWVTNTEYVKDDIVRIGSYTFRCVVAHTSSTSFESDRNRWAFFIGNLRLKKSQYYAHDVNISPISPAGDILMDADFAVDGNNKAIRLTHALSKGTQISVISKTSAVWENNRQAYNFLSSAPPVHYY